MQSQVYLLKFEHCVTLGESRHDSMVNNLLLLSAFFIFIERIETKRNFFIKKKNSWNFLVQPELEIMA